MNIETQRKIGYYTLLLAMSQSLKEELDLKETIQNLGFRYAVTEVGGNSNKSFQEKLNRAILGASLNNSLINKESNEIHALLHATEDARRGIASNSANEANLAMKCAILRSDHWISVAIFGESAFHPLTGHERCGLGVMNI